MKLHFHWNPTLINPNIPEIALAFEIHLATVNRIVKKDGQLFGNWVTPLPCARRKARASCCSR